MVELAILTVFLFVLWKSAPHFKMELMLPGERSQNLKAVSTILLAALSPRQRSSLIP